VDSFYWSEADDKVADYGILTHPQVNSLDYTWVGLSGCLLEIIYEDTVLLGEETTIVTLRFAFSDPDAEDAIIRDFFLNVIGGPKEGRIAWWISGGRSIPIDPGALPEETSFEERPIPTTVFIEKLVVGRLYPITLEIDRADRSIPEWCEGSWLCAINEPLGLLDPYPRGHDSHSYDADDYNHELYQLLSGETVPGPEMNYGNIYTLYVVPVYEPTE